MKNFTLSLPKSLTFTRDPVVDLAKKSYNLSKLQNQSLKNKSSPAIRPQIAAMIVKEIKFVDTTVINQKGAATASHRTCCKSFYGERGKKSLLPPNGDESTNQRRGNNKQNTSFTVHGERKGGVYSEGCDCREGPEVRDGVRYKDFYRGSPRTETNPKLLPTISGSITYYDYFKKNLWISRTENDNPHAYILHSRNNETLHISSTPTNKFTLMAPDKKSYKSILTSEPKDGDPKQNNKNPEPVNKNDKGKRKIFEQDKEEPKNREQENLKARRKPDFDAYVSRLAKAREDVSHLKSVSLLAIVIGNHVEQAKIRTKLRNDWKFLREENEEPLFTEEEFSKLLANDDPTFEAFKNLPSEGSFHIMSTNYSMVVFMNEMNLKKDNMSKSDSSKRKQVVKEEDTASSGLKRAKKMRL